MIIGGTSRKKPGKFDMGCPCQSLYLLLPLESPKSTCKAHQDMDIYGYRFDRNRIYGFLSMNTSVISPTIVIMNIYELSMSYPLVD